MTTGSGAAPGRVAVVTGASTGIGRAIAVYLARRGWRVFAGVRKPEDADSVATDHDAITPLMLDVTDQDSIEGAREAVAESVAQGAGIHGLVNNAGIVVPGPLEFVPIDELRRQFEVNAIAPIAVTQAFLPLLRDGRGRVVNIGSISGRIATPMMGPYCGSKFAIEAMSDSLRCELAPFGVSVCLVDPGNISTPIWQKTSSFAEELLPTMPEECETYYGDLIEKTFELAKRSERDAIPPEAVASAVAHALSARRPRTRYFVGSDAKLGSLLARVAPDRLRDRVVRRVIGV